MSTITKEFTKEQLIEHLRSRIEHRKGIIASIHIDRGYRDYLKLELLSSEIALASLEAEPVSVNDERYQHLSELYHAQEKRLFKLAQRIKGSSFDKYAHSTSQAIDVLESAIFGDSEHTCCAAMLQGADDEIGSWHNDKNTPTLREAVSALRNSGVDIDAEKILTERDALNSPVIPDGWVDCSERMPEDNAEQEVLACFKGGDISTLYYFEGRWEDAYGIVPIRQDVTHWMPLPEAPQQEVK